MAPVEKSALEVLAIPLTKLQTVGPRGDLFERLGLRSALDLLFFFPRDYQDLTHIRPIAELEGGQLQSAIGTIVDVEAHARSWRRSVLAVLVEDATDHLRCLWFNQPFMYKRFKIGQRVLISGKIAIKAGAREVSHPIVQWIESDEDALRGRILPVYSLTEGLTQHHVRRAVREILPDAAPLLEDALPEDFREARHLVSIGEAIHNIHFPADQQTLEAARRRFVYQELLILELAQATRRQQLQLGAKAPMLELTAKIDARIRRLFPFELTGSQREAIQEIATDLGRDFPMNRLLQGDVGSGKTVVAVFAMLLAIAHGYQAVLMAPTEVLARQHAATLDRLLSRSRVRRALLTGTVTDTERRQIRDRVAAGEFDLVIGTHAVLQNDLEFKKLGLVVIDEQHKFGVRQRASLKHAGADPHYLIMTATPIPRTISMTLFGDLDVSTLRDVPPGRQKVHTYVASPDKRESWWKFFREKLHQGRQGYVVAPLVEDSDEIAAASVSELYETLVNATLAEYRVGLIHGRLTAADKMAAMEAFSRGDLQVLVSTTVIEVGVDVPNATLMTIEGGERFGLSQLHQLRGRVSRGSFSGYCCVFADPATEESRQRLEAFAATTDGFKLAEVDFAIRGPGDLFGTRQHGLPPLRIADLLRDSQILYETRRDALEMVTADPGLRQPEHARLRRLMLVRYGAALDLGSVG